MSKQTDLALAEQFFEEAQTLSKQAKYQEAIKLLKQASMLYDKWEIWKKWGEAGNFIGVMHSYSGRYRESISQFQHVLTFWEKHFGKGHLNTLSSLNGLGVAYIYYGDYDSALTYLQKVLSILTNGFVNDPVKQAMSYNNIGICYLNKADYDYAIFYYQEGINLYKQHVAEDSRFVSSALDNIGVCLLRKGEYDIAIQYHQRALVIGRKIYGQDHPEIAITLSCLAKCYHFKKDYPQALNYYQQAYAINEKKFGQDHLHVNTNLTGIGICYYDNKEYDLAKQYFQKAISINKKFLGSSHPDLALDLRNIGNCYARKGNYKLALSQYQEGLVLLVPNFHNNNFYYNPAHFNSTRARELREIFEEKANTFLMRYQERTQNLKDLQAALATIITATEFVAYLRQSHKMEGSKHTLAERTSNLYDFAIDISLEVLEVYEQLSEIPQYREFPRLPYTIDGTKTLAFDFSEQCKAALLLSNLKNNEAKVSAKIPIVLLEQEKGLQSKLNELESGIAKQEMKRDEKDEVLIAQLQSEYFREKQQYDFLIEKFETDYPEYHQLKYSVSTASIQDLQSYLQKNNNSTVKPSNNSAILSYHIAEDKIYIFAISSNDYQIATVEKPSNFSPLIEKLQQDIQLGYVKEFIQSATGLFDVLLKPVWSFLQSVSKLIVIPHGELYYVPFDVLLNQHQITDIKNFTKLPYLVRDFDISYHYSATLLLHSHQRQLQTGERVDSFFGLAPVYFGGEKGNKKKEGYVVKSSGKQTERGRRILKSSGNAQAALEDLEETELEVKEVYQLFEEQGKEAIALFYDQANKQNLQEHIEDYKYVLISTHGFLQETGKNTLSGIHLAPLQNGGRQTVDGEWKETDDFLLHTSETYHLNLNADLVVLSSCESGVGELKVGEGMMALNRGFLYAGASNIVYSLFRVPQDSTSQLTQALFRYILEGESYGTALRKAKLELIEDEMMEPMDWAGFALVGG